MAAEFDPIMDHTPAEVDSTPERAALEPLDPGAITTGVFRTTTLGEVAKKRAWQTAAQSIAVDVVFAVVVVLMPLVSDASGWETVRDSWATWLFLVLRTAVLAVLAWAWRRFKDTAGVGITDIQPTA